MSKLLPSLSGVACVIWVSGWTWIFSEGKQATFNSSNPAPINILLDSVQYLVQHPFAFELAEATPIVSEELHPVLKSVVSHLEKNPELQLQVTGIYGIEENNQTNFPNLGIARAEAVKSMLGTAGASLMNIFTSSMSVDNLFELNGKLTGVIYFHYSSKVLENQTVAINDKSSETESGNSISEDVQTFNYSYGDYKVEKRHHDYLNNLRRDLRDNPNKSVVLTGYSTPEEEAESSRINLAEMRALAIRRYLVDTGTRRAQIEVKAKPSMARSSSEMIVSIQVNEY